MIEADPKTFGTIQKATTMRRPRPGARLQRAKSGAAQRDISARSARWDRVANNVAHRAADVDRSDAR